MDYSFLCKCVCDKYEERIIGVKQEIAIMISVMKCGIVFNN